MWYKLRVGFHLPYRGVVQSVERWSPKPNVEGSSPSAPAFFISDTMRGISAAGSAPHWQCGGHGFESRMLHFEYFIEVSSIFIIVLSGAIFYFRRKGSYKINIFDENGTFGSDLDGRNNTY